ncbi:MAG: Ig-like domain-containing protein [Bacteroidota bacterium]
MKLDLRHIVVVFVCLLMFSNCAKRGTPSGGPRDSVPPVIVRSVPENYTTNFTGDEIRIYFDEYIKLKDLQQNLIISPPLKYQPLITPLSTSKILKIQIQDTLLENTTYSINFGKSIVDNNEENEFEYYKYIFSTGSYIDSLTVQGRIDDALLAQPEGTTTILLYEINEAYTDSIIFSEKPTYITTTRDSTHQFQLTNLKEGTYRMIALQEEINNYIFEPKKDKIGFVEGYISTPNDSSYQISMFREIPEYKIARPNHNMKQRIVFGYEGIADSLEVRPLFELPEGYRSTTFHDLKKDTLHYFFDPPFDPEQTDTLYFMTRNRMVEDSVIVKIRDLFADSLQVERLSATTMIPRDTVKLQFNTPLVRFSAEKIQVLDKDSLVIPASASIDPYYNIASIEFEKTDEQLYNIQLLPEAFTDFFEQTHDTLNYVIRTQEVSDYGELGMTLLNVPKYPIIVELVSSKYEVVATRYLTENEELYFNYLGPDDYYFRIVYDTNENGKWDTGNFLRNEKPEQVVYFPKQINIRPNFFVNETFSLK